MDEEHYEDVDEIGGDDGDAAVDDGDRCLSLQDRCRLKMDPLRASSPSRSLPEVRFLRLLVSLYDCTGRNYLRRQLCSAAIRWELYARSRFAVTQHTTA